MPAPTGIAPGDFGEIPGANFSLESASAPEIPTPESVDSTLVKPNGSLVAIANGLEAVRDGARIAQASVEVVDQLSDHLIQPPNLDSAEQFMQGAFARVNREIAEQGRMMPPGRKPEAEMASAVFGVEGNKAFVTIGRVGDIGAYVVRGDDIFPFENKAKEPIDKKITLDTDDDTVEESGKTVPLGKEPGAKEFSVQSMQVQAGDRIILVSRGIEGVDTAERIRDIANGYATAAEISRALQAISRGERNSSAVAVIVNEVPEVVAEPATTEARKALIKTPKGQYVVNVTGFAGETDGVPFFNVEGYKDPVAGDQLFTTDGPAVAYVAETAQGNRTLLGKDRLPVKRDPLTDGFYNAEGDKLREPVFELTPRDVLSPSYIKNLRTYKTEIIKQLKSDNPDLSDTELTQLATDRIIAETLSRVAPKQRPTLDTNIKRFLDMKPGKTKWTGKVAKYDRRIRRAQRRAKYVHKVEHRYEQREHKRNNRDAEAPARKLRSQERRAERAQKALRVGKVAGRVGMRGITATGRGIATAGRATGRGVAKAGRYAYENVGKLDMRYPDRPSYSIVEEDEDEGTI